MGQSPSNAHRVSVEANQRVEPPTTMIIEPPSIGIELRLSGVPHHMSAHNLKVALGEGPLRNMRWNFLVLLKTSSEELFWKSIDDDEDDDKITAQVIIPDNFQGFNSGKGLVGQNISLQYLKTTFEVHVTIISNPETTNHKYEELRLRKRVANPVEGLKDGRIGNVLKVSSGNLDHNNKF